MLPGFSCRNLVAVLIKYDEEGAEWRLVICSAYLPYNSEDPPPSKEFKELMQYCENENLYLVVCDSNAHHNVWGSTNFNIWGVDLVEFLNSWNLEILNRGNEPNFCNGGRLEVIDFTVGSVDSRKYYRLSVSSEPSLSYHRHYIHCTGIRTVTTHHEP